jgi:hypothetical protein
MPRLREATGGATFEPDWVKMLGEIFDEVWACVAPDLCGQDEDIDAERIRLAVIVLDLAKDGQLGPQQIARRQAG